MYLVHMEVGLSCFLLLVLFQPLQIAVYADIYDGSAPRHYNRERRLGKVVLYRSTGSGTQYVPDVPLGRDRHYYHSYSPSSKNDKGSFQERRDIGSRYIPYEEEYYRSHRSRSNSFTNSNRKYVQKRISHDFPENYNNDIGIRRQDYLPQRTPNNINEYINRFNYDTSNEAFYNDLQPHFYDRRFRPDALDFLLAAGPGGYRHASLAELQAPPVHKDMTTAHFPRGNPNQDFSNLFEGQHRFSAGSRRPTTQEHHHHYLYKGVPVYDGGNSAEKDYDPRFIALYRSVVEAFRNKQAQQQSDGKQNPENLTKQKSNSQPSKKPQNGKNIFQQFIDQTNKPYPITQHQQYEQPIQPPDNGIFFPNFVYPNYRPGEFRPSPPFYRYSEPDPLYHPNRSPFQTYEPPPAPTTEPPKPTMPSTMTTTTPRNSDKPFKFPDSINAQLPPPGDDVDTRIPYVAATVVTPQTSIHDQTTPIHNLQTLQENTTTVTNLFTTNTSQPFQNQWDVLPKLAVQKSTLSHELPPLNLSQIFHAESPATTTVKSLQILHAPKNIMPTLSTETIGTTSEKRNLQSREPTTTPEKPFSVPNNIKSLHFLPTINTEELTSPLSLKLPEEQTFNTPASQTASSLSIQDGEMTTQLPDTSSNVSIAPSEEIALTVSAKTETPNIFSSNFNDNLLTEVQTLSSGIDTKDSSSIPKLLRPDFNISPSPTSTNTITDSGSEILFIHPTQNPVYTQQWNTKLENDTQIAEENSTMNQTVNTSNRHHRDNVNNPLHENVSPAGHTMKEETTVVDNDLTSTMEEESSTELVTAVPSYHHIMSLINQARTHIILSQNGHFH